MPYAAIQAMYVDHIIVGAKQANQRTGQFLYNHLPRECVHTIAAQLWDPFHYDLNWEQIYDWIDNHIIFQSNIIVAIFNKNEILWTLPDPDSLR